MSINIQQLILEAQKMANRNKELVALSNSLLVEAESNNRTLEAMRQFQEDMDSLNNLARNKSNSDMINRINQQNPSIRETRNENRELKATLEDHQRVLEIVMQKYREHTQQNLFKSPVNLKELYNEKLLEVIKKQAEKINEMAAVMQKAAQADDEDFYKELEWNTKLQNENQSLRELLQVANDFGSSAEYRSSVGISDSTNTGAAISNRSGLVYNAVGIDDVKNSILLNSNIATSSTSSGYGTSSIATSIQSSRLSCRSCEDKAIQTEFSEGKLSKIEQEKSPHSPLNKSLDDDEDEDSVIENKQIKCNVDDKKESKPNTVQNNQLLENGNINKTNVNKISTSESISEQYINGKNSNNNSPNKKPQQQINDENNVSIKLKQNEDDLNNQNNKNSLTTNQQNENSELSKYNLTNGIAENSDIKQLNVDSRLNTLTCLTTENQENNNKSKVSS